MTLKVDFVTLGDAAKRLGVPAPTLRSWSIQLEEYEAHYTMRIHKNDRIFYDSDIKIFAFLRDLKKEHGRRTTTRDLSRTLLEMGAEGKFELRKKEDDQFLKLSRLKR